ncbi:Npun_F0494 family protein, partial [Planktothrix sp.]|uniref:Npun_F0494 family protein n=1 Tax=Planktothrix sp. TaxID=3088171 RepID=UPI0038D3621B
MTVLDSPGKSSIEYSERTLKRAERALRCSPFQLQLFTTMRFSSVSLNGIAGQSGVNSGYTQTGLTELAVENGLLWLIQVGILRREVDGQGITDSFRLTPLGRKLIDQWES